MRGFWYGQVFVWGITILALIGQGASIYKFIKCDFNAPYKAEVIYGIGSVTPIGAIIGYLNIEDK